MKSRYFYRSLGYVEMDRLGVKMYRDASMPSGKWYPLPNSIDRLIDHLMVITRHVKTESFLKHLNIQAAGVTRVRQGVHGIPLDWLVKMADYSGLSLKELRIIGGLKPSMPRYDALSSSNQQHRDAA